jgi:acyl-CoA synthetase (AMP-forming)/AMP-acid ligase II
MQSTLVLIPRYDADKVVQGLSDHKITYFAGGPAPIYMGLLASPLFKTADLSLLKYCPSGGAPCPAELHREWRERVGQPLLEGWGMTEGAPFLSGRTVAVAGTNAALKFVAYPISRQAERRGRALLNWVAEVKRPGWASLEGADGNRADWNRQGRLDDVLPWFADWKFGWLDVPALITGAPRILEYPMVDRDPLPSWGSEPSGGTGRVTLLGDAAHPMYPIGANGGSQAVLDARVLAWSLARALSSSGTPAEGLAAYEAARRETVNAIVLACRDMPADRLLQTVSTRAPGGFERIEDVLSTAELAAFDQAYRSTTLPDVAVLNSRPSLSVTSR